MTSIIQRKPLPPIVRPATKKPPITSPAALKQPLIRANDTGRVPPSERNVSTPPARSTAPSTANSKPYTGTLTGEAAPANISQYMPRPAQPAQPSSRLGTPISIKDAPGYRGIGVPLMPSSLSMRAKKGGVITTRKISTATKSKKQSNW